jgi:DNA replication protein DnaC
VIEPTCMGEQALREEAQDAVDAGGGSLETHLTELQWSPVDSPYYLHGEEHFAEVQRLLDARPDPFLTRALKAPSLRAAASRLAERARTEGWSHEEFLAACLQREVAARETHGGEGRIRAARFPARKSLEEFDFDHARGLKRETIAHLGTLDFVAAKDNVVFLGPPGTGKTHLATGLGVRACQAGHRVLFATAAHWVARLADAHAAGRLQAELARLGRYPLLVVDEVGYIPFEAEAANLFFQLVSARYERASLIVTSNKPFGRWGEVFGDDVVAAAMIDRLVHHADVVALKGDSYRLRNRDLGRVPAATTDEQ